MARPLKKKKKKTLSHQHSQLEILVNGYPMMNLLFVATNPEPSISWSTFEEIMMEVKAKMCPILSSLF